PTILTSPFPDWANSGFAFISHYNPITRLSQGLDAASYGSSRATSICNVLREIAVNAPMVAISGGSVPKFMLGTVALATANTFIGNHDLSQECKTIMTVARFAVRYATTWYFEGSDAVTSQLKFDAVVGLANVVDAAFDVPDLFRHSVNVLNQNHDSLYRLSRLSPSATLLFFTTALSVQYSDLNPRAKIELSQMVGLAITASVKYDIGPFCAIDQKLTDAFDRFSSALSEYCPIKKGEEPSPPSQPNDYAATIHETDTHHPACGIIAASPIRNKSTSLKTRSKISVPMVKTIRAGERFQRRGPNGRFLSQKQYDQQLAKLQEKLQKSGAALSDLKKQPHSIIWYQNRQEMVVAGGVIKIDGAALASSNWKNTNFVHQADVTGNIHLLKQTLASFDLNPSESAFVPEGLQRYLPRIMGDLAYTAATATCTLKGGWDPASGGYLEGGFRVFSGTSAQVVASILDNELCRLNVRLCGYVGEGFEYTGKVGLINGKLIYRGGLGACAFYGGAFYIEGEVELFNPRTYAALLET
ncbi:hypothetical protein EBR96_09005, partial [bacterium]|nr:hypothetical protein [bacterium]